MQRLNLVLLTGLTVAVIGVLTQTGASADDNESYRNRRELKQDLREGRREIQKIVRNCETT